MGIQDWFQTEYEGYQIDGTYTGGDTDEACIEELFINGSNSNAVQIVSQSVVEYLQRLIENRSGEVFLYRSEMRQRFVRAMREAA